MRNLNFVSFRSYVVVILLIKHIDLSVRMICRCVNRARAFITERNTRREMNYTRAVGSATERTDMDGALTRNAISYLTRAVAAPG